MKILAIGNSFSEDATYYLYKIARSAGKDLTVVNLYVSGCSLKMHAKNIAEDVAAYRYERNGVYTDRKVSIREVLREEAWDVVTVQQQSGHSGIYETYGSDFLAVLACVRENAPQAKIYFHETWAYETGSTNSQFSLYDNDSNQMHAAIKATTARICAENGGLPMIPAGDLVQAARQHPAFCVESGGQRLCRDGFHMHILYGRYLVGLTWFAVLLGGNVEDVTFVPSESDLVNDFKLDPFCCDAHKIGILKDIVKEYF